jgi:hypothetical protein
MLILNNNNQTFDLNNVGKVLVESVYYGVFDYSDKANGDYFFRPLVMTELFDNTAVEFQIGKYKIMLPQEWSIVLGDPETGDVELILIDEINTRKFHALIHNPIGGIMHKFMPITPVDAFADVGWAVPRLGFHNFLLVPLAPGPNPDCIFIINEKDQKKIPQLDLNLFI